MRMIIWKKMHKYMREIIYKKEFKENKKYE